MNTSSIPGPGPDDRVMRMAAWILAAIVTGFACFAGYVIHTQKLFDSCRGGASDSYPAAGVVLGPAGAGLTLHKPHGPLFFAGFVAAYLVLLVVLSHLAPSLWGPMSCTTFED